MKRDPNSLKKAALTMRLPEQLHQALVKSADNELLSVSAEAERRLKRTFDEDDQVGDVRLSALLRSMAASSSLIIEIHGPMRKSPAAGRAIHDAWHDALDRFLPIITGIKGPDKSVRELLSERSRLERRVRVYREAHGLDPLPFRSVAGPHSRPHDLTITEGKLIGGALDALAKEYENRLVPPTDEETRWAEITDEIQIIKAQHRSDAKGLGASVNLMIAMMGMLTPAERSAVVKALDRT